MNLLRKLWLKGKIEFNFYMVHKWGLKKMPGKLEVPKYALKKYLPKDPVIIDCGAHIGSDSVELSRIFPNAQIHSFEPVPHLYEKLKWNTRRRSNITCYPYALSNSNGTATMYVSSGSSDASSSLLAPTGHMDQHADVKFNDVINVQTFTLDSWAEKYNVKKVDFMWLDMQGFEYPMLQASAKIFPSVKAIHTEVNPTELYKDSVLYPQFKSWLESRGFKVKAEMPDSTDIANVLFAKA